MGVEIILTSRAAENGFGPQWGGGDSGPPPQQGHSCLKSLHKIGKTDSVASDLGLV